MGYKKTSSHLRMLASVSSPRHGIEKKGQDSKNSLLQNHQRHWKVSQLCPCDQAFKSPEEELHWSECVRSSSSLIEVACDLLNWRSCIALQGICEKRSERWLHTMTHVSFDSRQLLRDDRPEWEMRSSQRCIEGRERVRRPIDVGRQRSANHSSAPTNMNAKISVSAAKNSAHNPPPPPLPPHIRHRRRITTSLRSTQHLPHRHRQDGCWTSTYLAVLPMSSRLEIAMY